MHGSALQGFAVCVAMCCSMVQFGTVCVAVRAAVRVAVRVVAHVAVCSSALQCFRTAVGRSKENVCIAV